MRSPPAPQRRLAVRLRLARAALLWERVWPAAGPALGVLLLFAATALFDLLPLLPGRVHAAILALFALAFAAALAWGLRTAGLAWPDPLTARRRIELSSGLPHRPLAALADRPSTPLDGDAAALWAAHQRRMAAAVRRLRVGWPAAGLSRRDPWGVRSVVAIVLLLAALDAGGDWRDRLARAVTPRLNIGAAAVATNFDMWLTPPEYTGLAPQFLRPGAAETVKVPTGSVLLAQLHGGAAVPRLTIDRTAHDFAAVDQHNFRFQTTLAGGSLLTLSQDGTVLGRWPIVIVPDQPPTIAFVRPPAATPRAALRLDYRASDDYGVESVKAVIRRVGGNPQESIQLELPLPGVHLKKAEAASYHDLTPHPWAGLPVEVSLAATDALGQRGDSPPVRMVLPERAFHNPVARAIIDQRKELVKDPSAPEPVAEILGDLNKRPALYRDDVVVYLALRVAQQRLRHETGKASVTAVEQLLWDTALRIEDGNLSLAERELRRLQERLQDALAKGAPDAEVDRLMAQLREALDRYMQSLAQQLQQQPPQPHQPLDPSKVITSRDLQRMLERAGELARSGDREQARQLLSQLQSMLENLRTARPGQMQRGASEAQQTMRGLQELMQRQQQLLDRSFRAERQQGQPGSPDQSGQQSGQQPGVEQDNPGQPGDMGDAAGQQETLRHQLGDVMRRLGEGLGDIPAPFGRAERAMRDAAGALQRSQPGEAIAPQTEALDQLQQAARDFAQQLRQRYGDQMGTLGGDELGATDRDPRNQGQRDPFGRPTSNSGTYDLGFVKIPDHSILQKSREILDELRRRAGERSRPQIELDYIDRLLKRF
ncbi:MAG TPA: TIGR02302 family protein [Stellaceae bacterium]|nr:TIGR02302 family protein [Stellaceae bacterium]